jgi:uncharacterized protein (UPF0332 family)
MNDSNRIENAKLEIAKGNSAWEDAEILFERGKYDGAVSRAYYAAFHYAGGLLMTRGLEARSHRGMQRMFHLHFIRTGVFSQNTGVLLSHAQKAREEADYFPEVTFSKEIAQDRLNDVSGFLKVAKEFLKKNLR